MPPTPPPRRPGRPPGSVNRPKALPTAGQLHYLPVSMRPAVAPSAPASRPSAPNVPPPIDDGDYAATDAMVRFRLTATRCLAMEPSMSTPPEWVDTHRLAHPGDAVTLTKFLRWKEDAKFSAWFYAAITWTPDKFDEAMLHGALFRKVTKGVENGDLRSLELASELLGVRKRARDQESLSAGEELRRFKERGAAAPAAPPSAAAERLRRRG